MGYAEIKKRKKEGMKMKKGKNINNALMVVAGPIIGLLYAVLFPFIGIAVLAKLGLQKVLAPVTVPGYASFGWRPSESYLAGKKKNKKDE